MSHTCTYAQHMHSMHMHRTCLTCMHAPDHNAVRQCTLKPYDMVVALDDVPHICVDTYHTCLCHISLPRAVYTLRRKGKLAPRGGH